MSLASFLGTSTKIFYFAFPVPPALTGGISLAAGEKLITGCKINLSLSFVSQRYLSRLLLNMQAFSLLAVIRNTSLYSDVLMQNSKMQVCTDVRLKCFFCACKNAKLFD